MSKAKKGIIATIFILGALVVLVVIFGVFFSLRSIYVDYATTANRISEYSREQVIEKSGIKKGKNLIFMNFDKATEKLEKSFPYAKFDIVRTFPNKVTIYMYEREPVFRIKDENGFWQIYDEDLKCLEIVESDEGLTENDNNLVPALNLKNGGLELASLGNRINNVLFQTKYTSIIDGIYGVQESPMSIMSDITLDYNAVSGHNICTLTIRETGTKLVVEGDQYLKEKIAKGLYIYLSQVSNYIPDNNGWVHQGHLDKVEILVENTFTPTNQKVSVKCPICDAE